jgi:hypothetical protein
MVSDPEADDPEEKLHGGSDSEVGVIIDGGG